MTLSYYSEFFSDPFPSLLSASTVNIQDKVFRERNYSVANNTPILHKKELLIPKGHHMRPLFEQLTRALEANGLNPNQAGLGFRNQWNAYLEESNVTIKNHILVE